MSDLTGILIKAALFMTTMLVGLLWLWRFARTKAVTALACPKCGGRTALTASRPDINCRYCHAPVRRGGHLCDGVKAETVKLLAG